MTDRFEAVGSPGQAPHVVVIDNYDSFTYNLVHGLCGAGADVTVHRNDAIDRDALAAAAPAGIVLSPGPGSPDVPRDVGVCRDLIEDPLDVPMLGVCLGMQAMALHTGGTVDRAPEVVHGEATPITLERDGLFDAVSGTVDVGRYHSLCIHAATLPASWQPLAVTDDGIVMAMRHRQRPWLGVQFHPESILTPEGPRMLQNFVGMCR